MNSIIKLSNLEGRVALITGATGALGKIICETLAELGADLILVDRFESELVSLAESISTQWKNQVNYKTCDLEDDAQRKDLVSWVSSRKKLNILINNAAFVGTSELQGWAVPFQEQKIDTWRRAIEVNLTAVFDLCQGLYPLLKSSEGANIINVCSIYGMYGPDWSLYEDTSMSNPAAYGASKGGLIQLTRWLATTIKPEVRVNSISPGGIYRNQAQQFVNRYEARTPLGRMATENDFRGVFAFLASDLSSYITGENISVDGGWGIW